MPPGCHAGEYLWYPLAPVPVMRGVRWILPGEQVRRLKKEDQGSPASSESPFCGCCCGHCLVPCRMPLPLHVVVVSRNGIVGWPQRKQRSSLGRPSRRCTHLSGRFCICGGLGKEVGQGGWARRLGTEFGRFFKEAIACAGRSFVLGTRASSSVGARTVAGCRLAAG